MRYLPVILSLLAFSVSGMAQWASLETVRFDWNRNGKAYTFFVEYPKGESDFDHSSRLRILEPNGTQYVFAPFNGTAELSEVVSPNWVLPHLTTLIKRNPVRSRYLLFLPSKLNSGNPFLLFLFGWPYGSSFGSIHVIALNNGVPTLILHRTEFQLLDYRFGKGSGVTTILGEPCMSEVWGDGFYTYDPYLVYELPPTGASEAKLSIPLSKDYNLQHYYGWAGPACSEKLTVIPHPPGGGKPEIVDEKRADELQDQSGKH